MSLSSVVIGVSLSLVGVVLLYIDRLHRKIARLEVEDKVDEIKKGAHDEVYARSLKFLVDEANKRNSTRPRRDN